MIYSRSTEYAIRALIPLAQVPDGRYTMVKTIAEQESIPTHFLAKILQQLARKGLLKSSKGPLGGFQLNVPAENISLLDIVEALDGLEPYQINAVADPDAPDGLYCTMHDEWLNLREEIVTYLRDNSVADLAKALEVKRRTLARKAKRRAAAAARKN
ncbi:MAG TPA: Rrf2 family transcriptional regulator [Bryobacteraceae bacterium]|nr:Rrf2 family transcriptional regulator [Bryobacteraceae bacterium]